MPNFVLFRFQGVNCYAFLTMSLFDVSKTFLRCNRIITGCSLVFGLVWSGLVCSGLFCSDHPYTADAQIQSYVRVGDNRTKIIVSTREYT